MQTPSKSHKIQLSDMIISPLKTESVKEALEALLSNIIFARILYPHHDN